MYIFIWIYLQVYIHKNLYIFCICTDLHLYKYVYMHKYKCTYVHMYIFVSFDVHIRFFWTYKIFFSCVDWFSFILSCCWLVVAGSWCLTWCSVLQCVAVCCSVLRYAAVCCSAKACRCGRLVPYRCCSVLQCFALCYSVLQVAVCCAVLQCDMLCAAMCCTVLYCVALCCSALALRCGSLLPRMCETPQHQPSVLHCAALHCSVLQCVAFMLICTCNTPHFRLSVLQYAAVCCSVLQCAAVCAERSIRSFLSTCCLWHGGRRSKSVEMPTKDLSIYRLIPFISRSSATRNMMRHLCKSLLHLECHFFVLKSQLMI